MLHDYALCKFTIDIDTNVSASEMTYFVSGGALNSTHSLTDTNVNNSQHDRRDQK